MKPEEKEASKMYDKWAEEYHEWRTKKNPHGWFYNEMLEMPATMSLLGNVKGKKILDFGCGTGIYAKMLTKRGSIVKGFDISNEMLAIAKRENPKLDLRWGSGYKIPFKEEFDIVLASLTVHYLKDWNRMFKEIRKVLKKGGYFVFSTGNPVAEARKQVKCGKRKLDILDGYFKEGRVPIGKLYSHHKTYETIIKYIINNGFEIVDYKDCYPAEKAKKYFPAEYKEYSRKPFFCAWKVMKK